jgi:hypothetical protein
VSLNWLNNRVEFIGSENPALEFYSGYGDLVKGVEEER